MAEGKLPSKISKRISMMKQWLPFLNPWKSVRWMRGRYFSPSTWTEITQQADMGELRVYSGYCRKRWKEKVHESTLLCMITYCYNITYPTKHRLDQFLHVVALSYWEAWTSLWRDAIWWHTLFFFGGGHWGCILLVHVGILVTIETDNQMSEILIKLGFLLVERFG